MDKVTNVFKSKNDGRYVGYYVLAVAENIKISPAFFKFSGNTPTTENAWRFKSKSITIIPYVGPIIPHIFLSKTGECRAGRIVIPSIHETSAAFSSGRIT